MALRKYAYFSVGAGANANAEAVMIPVDNILGLDIEGGTNMVGDSLNLTAIEVGDEHNTKKALARFTHKGGRAREAMAQITEALASNPKNGFIVFNQDTLNFSAGQNDVITEVAVTLTE
mgnify:CR=1 FL=1|tara:strand:- start:86 stop:442 length:357 start_codon:yes stop_codon:yes gene_type:complete